VIERAVRDTLIARADEAMDEDKRRRQATRSL